jgi:acyl carrier protein
MRDYEGELRAITAEELGVKAATIETTTTFESLGADSLDLFELAMIVEDKFDCEQIADAEVKDLSTFGDLVELIKRKVEAA